VTALPACTCPDACRIRRRSRDCHRNIPTSSNPQDNYLKLVAGGDVEKRSPDSFLATLIS
jgi:hypothetical protein